MGQNELTINLDKKFLYQNTYNLNQIIILVSRSRYNINLNDKTWKQDAIMFQIKKKFHIFPPLKRIEKEISLYSYFRDKKSE